MMLVLKRSHNHPSYIEPYQGAATVGGILRDVYNGATYSFIKQFILAHLTTLKLKFTQRLSQVLSYGTVLIPTVAGETKFDETYNENILVNAMAVGLAQKIKFSILKLKA